MKNIMLLFLLSGCYFGFAQNIYIPKAALHQQPGTDSVTLYFNQDYSLVPDTCATIVRRTRFDLAEARFRGAFVDYSLQQPGQVLAKGSYDEEGLREGDFSAYYSNGNLQARGAFRQHRFYGRWDLYYADGSPRLSFSANGGDIKVLATWNEDGKPVVKNGYGPYELKSGNIFWKGLLVGGTPDGTWIAYTYLKEDRPFLTEKFKLGEFVEGKNQVGKYKDSSRIFLITPELFPPLRAEALLAFNAPCHFSRATMLTPAMYRLGTEAFTNEIMARLAPVLSNLQLTSFIEPIELYGTVLENGKLNFYTSKALSSKAASALISALNDLPFMEPARLDNKMVRQEIVVSVSYNASVYRFNYRLLPVKEN